MQEQKQVNQKTKQEQKQPEQTQLDVAIAEWTGLITCISGTSRAPLLPLPPPLARMDNKYIYEQKRTVTVLVSKLVASNVSTSDWSMYGTSTT